MCPGLKFLAIETGLLELSSDAVSAERPNKPIAGGPPRICPILALLLMPTGIVIF